MERSLIWGLALWFWIPVQTLLLFGGLWITNQESLPVNRFFGFTVATGFTVGIIGNSVAHELMHRNNLIEKIFAKCLMSMASYPHFCAVHISEHHRHVGTPHDSVTARLGENLYGFFPRAVTGGLIHAFKSEKNRLRQLGLGFLSWKNRLVWDGIILAAIYSGIAYGFGWSGVIFFMGQGLIAICTLETINYIQHYGLTRSELKPGHYDKVRPRHSWNCRNRISNWFLFNLGLHSDHHCEGRRPYQDLRDLDDVPQLPANYFVMLVVALIPPLWHCVMDRRAILWDKAKQITV